MIKILGMQRVIILAVLAGLCVVLAGTKFLILLPQIEVSQRESSQVKSKVNGLRNDINRLQVEFSQIEEQRAEFETLRTRGFFNNQDRSQIDQIFKDLQTQSKVVSASVKVESGALQDNPEAMKAKHKILSSKIMIDIQALEEADIYRYLTLLKTALPGEVTFQSYKVSRDNDVNEAVLRAIASSQETNLFLVGARLEVLWRTMVPETTAISNAQGGT
jgi:hypothetical protein